MFFFWFELMSKIVFKKMHGLKNDFVILDFRKTEFQINTGILKKISDRKIGVGCDQIIIIKKSTNNIADARMLIFNSDGTESETCGNATRCVGKILFEENKVSTALIDTKGGLLDVELEKNGNITVDMGMVKLDWRDIPLSEPLKPSNLGLKYRFLKDGYTLNLGNPHIVFFVDKELSSNDLKQDCIEISKLKTFPMGININIVKKITDCHISLNIFERGSGFTSSCGSGACASVVAAFKLGYCERKTRVSMEGGDLDIDFMKDNHVIMSGPVALSYVGEFDHQFLNE